MRAVIQRVSRASCQVEGKITGKIDLGIVVLLGVEEHDELSDLEWLTSKLVNLRIFADQKGQMNRSIREVDGEILLISQFTLLAQTKKGNRPSFVRAAPAAFAQPLYEKAGRRLSELLNKETQMGIFGADMKIELLGDGPVTIIMNTKDKEHF
ncbi:MAG: D-aminoacyl-tRNA deacylase [Sphingobacterium sp.]